MAANDQESGVRLQEGKRSREQKRADHALRTIRMLKGLDQNQDTEKPLYGNLRAYVENLPAMIVMNGLGQAMATELAAARMGEEEIPKGNRDLSGMIEALQYSAKGNRNADVRAHELLFFIVSDWLQKSRAYSYSEDEGLMEAIVSGNQKEYVRAQHEALAYLEWLKKFSQAFLQERRKG
ncbi:MAG: type III-B CRISPR module-associated protein Cmr5 [Methanothrix sp.]|nr:type III-B CRISPR module-associated protein Cmr5 [Methanothrix sp.]